MAIRFRVPAEAVERVSHAYSPLLEAVLSLHVLVEPKHHPLQHPWVRRSRSLPAELKRGIAAFSFAYRVQVPDLLAPSTEHELRSFDDELESLRGLDAETVALEFTRPLYDTEGRRDPALLDRKEVRRHLVGAARFFHASPELVRLVWEDPLRLRDEFADLLERYWRAAFAAEWERLEPLLAEAVSDAGRRIASEGLYPFLRSLSLQLRG